MIDDYVRQVDVVLCGHRATATRARLLANRLFAELEEALTYRDDIEEAIEAETEADRKPMRRERMHRAVGLQARASTLNSLASAGLRLGDTCRVERLASRRVHLDQR